MQKLWLFWEKHYLKSLSISGLLSLFYVFSVQSSVLYGSVLNYQNIQSDPFDGTVYPIEYVPDPFLVSYQERRWNFIDIDTNKFIKIPQYDPAVFTKNPDDFSAISQEYKQILTQRLIYTVPYMWNYEMDYQEYGWSHPGIDIVVPRGTPIRNIANGVIVDIGSQPNGFWNYVLVRHDDMIGEDGKKTDIYVLYAHMEKVEKEKWIKVAKGEKLGTVGDSGTATTPHLHFQIDLDEAPYSPYWPFTSADMKAAWVSFFGGVTLWLGKENAIRFTMNPLKFVNSHISSLPPPVVVQKPEEKKDNIPQTQDNTQKPPVSEVVVDPIVNELTQEEILQKELLLLTNDTQLELSESEKFTDLNKESPTQLDEKLNTILDVVDDVWGTVFRDIPDDAPIIEALKYFKEKEIIKWFSDGTFKPKNNLTRIEWFKIMFLSFDKKPQSQSGSVFIDVKENSWENGYVNLWVDLGVFSTKNSQFFPLREISRIEAIKTIVLLSWVQLESYQSDLVIEDISKEDWKYKYAAFAVERWFIGLKNNTFLPNQALTREELVKILFRVLKK